MSNSHEAKNINALYPRPKGRGSTAIFDSEESFAIFNCSEDIWEVVVCEKLIGNISKSSNILFFFHFQVLLKCHSLTRITFV